MHSCTSQYHAYLSLLLPHLSRLMSFPTSSPSQSLPSFFRFQFLLPHSPFLSLHSLGSPLSPSSPAFSLLLLIFTLLFPPLSSFPFLTSLHPSLPLPLSLPLPTRSLLSLIHTASSSLILPVPLFTSTSIPSPSSSHFTLLHLFLYSPSLSLLRSLSLLSPLHILRSLIFSHSPYPSLSPLPPLLILCFFIFSYSPHPSLYFALYPFSLHFTFYAPSSSLILLIPLSTSLSIPSPSSSHFTRPPSSSFKLSLTSFPALPCP